MIDQLRQYLRDPEHAQANFDLGRQYEQLGQTGAAISFYLRAAERSQLDLLQYQCLLRMALCFERQRTRDDTLQVLLQKAIKLCMHRPEAYYLLSRSYERRHQWHEGWLISAMAQRLCDWNLPPLPVDVEYPGQWAVLFEHAVCGWWVGEHEASRQLMFELRYDWPIDAAHRRACEHNLRTCGWPRQTEPYQTDWQAHSRLQWPGLDEIDHNHSQCLQDLFVLAANQGQREQWYLEIGSAEPVVNNNTALLEQQFGWRGISVDIDPAKTQQFARQRVNPVLCMDATTADWAQILAQHGAPPQQGYLQIDCDPPQTSLRILKSLPWHRYRWRAITFEHDYYADASVRDQSRQWLCSQGYHMVVGDVAFDGRHSFEDWWVDPNLVPGTVLDRLRHQGNTVISARDYLFPGARATQCQIPPAESSATPALR